MSTLISQLLNTNLYVARVFSFFFFISTSIKMKLLHLKIKYLQFTDIGIKIKKLENTSYGTPPILSTTINRDKPYILE